MLVGLLSGLSGKTLIIAVVGLVLLAVGLLKKIKFIIKLGLIVAIVSFIATGGLAMFLPGL